MLLIWRVRKLRRRVDMNSCSLLFCELMACSRVIVSIQVDVLGRVFWSTVICAYAMAV